MPKPFNKAQLLDDIHKERKALELYLDKLDPDALLYDDVVGDWSAKDVLAHLIEWEQMVLGWYQAGQRGETPILPAPGYKWNQLPALNQHIYEKHRDRSLRDIRAEFSASYQQMLQLIDGLSEAELFSRGHYPWAGNNPLASYINSCTASHYRWAKKEIQKGLRAK